MSPENIIRETLRGESQGNEVVLGWLRCCVGFAIVPDLIASSASAAQVRLDAAVLLYFAAALGLTYLLRRRGWFKYAITTADLAAIVLYLAVAWGQAPADHKTIVGDFGYQALLVALVVVASAIRVSRPAVAYATGLGLATLMGIWLAFPADNLAAAGSMMLLAVMGGLSLFVMMRLSGLIELVTHKDQLARFLPPELVEQMSRDPSLLRLGGRRQSVTMLFADIREFSKLAEAHSPEDVVGLLNDYLRLMTEAIFLHRGTLDKFMGDALLALFGAPLGNPDDADRAVRAAVEMMTRLAEFNRRRAEGGRAPIRIGIGINTATVIAGNIGTEQRMEYTVIGDGVNVAARLEKLTKQYDAKIILSQSTYDHLAGPQRLGAAPLGEVKVEGRSAAIHIFGIGGVPRAANS